MPRDQQDEGIAESKDELDEAMLDCPLEMLGVGCVRSGSTSKSKEEDQSEEHLETDRLGHGILRSENIVKLGFEWRSRMVVLSACNTAKGRVSTDVSTFLNSYQHSDATPVWFERNVHVVRSDLRSSPNVRL